MTDTYEFRGFVIRPDMMEGIRDYIDWGLEPGSFLTAVICNDLREAVAHADDNNMRNLAAFVAYFYNDAPSSCWGSREKMEAHIERKAAERQEATRSEPGDRSERREP